MECYSFQVPVYYLWIIIARKSKIEKWITICDTLIKRFNVPMAGFIALSYESIVSYYGRISTEDFS